VAAAPEVVQASAAAQKPAVQAQVVVAAAEMMGPRRRC
jgi:hypothetical protein